VQNGESKPWALVKAAFEYLDGVEGDPTDFISL